MNQNALMGRFRAEAVATAPPASLLTMLYDRLVLDLDRGAAALDAGRRDEANAQLTHAQAIVHELRSCLDVGAWSGAGGLASYGMAMGYGASLAAEKGFDVPAGVNPVTQLHQKEMVLPASLADNVRNMTGGSNQPINVNISAVDSRSVRDLFMREGNALSDAIRKQSRSFGLTGKDLRGTAR